MRWPVNPNLPLELPNVDVLSSAPLTDGLQVPVMAALPFVRLLRYLQSVLRGAQRLVLVGAQPALRFLVNLR